MAKTITFEGAQHSFPDDATDAEISKALSGPQVKATEHPWERVNRMARAGIRPPEAPTARQAAVEGGTAIGSAMTGGMGPLAGAAVRTGLAAAEPMLAGTGGVGTGGLRGLINAGMEAALPVGGKIMRSLPWQEGRLVAGIGERQAAKQASEDTLVDTTNKMIQGTHKSLQTAGKAASVADADSTNAKNVQKWMLEKRGIAQKNELAGRTYRADTAIAKQEAQAADQAANEVTGQNVRGTIAEQVPASGVSAYQPKSLQDFAWGEKGWDPIKNQMNEGQQAIIDRLAAVGGTPSRTAVPKNYQRPMGQIIDVPSRPAMPPTPGAGQPMLNVGGETPITFDEAWKTAGQLKGKAREVAFDSINSELKRLDPTGEAGKMFGDLRRQYSLAVTAKGIGKASVEPTGGAFNADSATDWWNKRRDVLNSRLGDERYGQYEKSLFEGRGAGSARPETQPRPINPPTIVKDMPPKPATVDPQFTPTPAPTPIQPRQIPAEAEVNSLPPLARWLMGRSTVLTPNIWSRWSGPQIPYKPSSATRSLFDLFGQQATHPENKQ